MRTVPNIPPPTLVGTATTDHYPSPSLALSPTAQRALSSADPLAPRCRAVDVLFGLRAEDAAIGEFAASRALLDALYGPDPADLADPMPALLAEAYRAMDSRHREQRAASAEAMQRRDDIAAATWVDEAIGNEMTETAQDVLSSAPTVLTTDDSLTNALADLDELLAMPLPGTHWQQALLSVLPAHVVARMKGWVA